MHAYLSASPASITVVPFSVCRTWGIRTRYATVYDLVKDGNGVGSECFLVIGSSLTMVLTRVLFVWMKSA